MPRLGGRTRDLVERRQSLARVLITLFFARIATTIVEVAESHVTWWSVLVTAAIGIEAWRAWTVVRAARRGAAEGRTPAPIADSAWDRMLRPVERYGPAVLIALTVVFVAAAVVLAIAGTSRDTLLDIGLIGREATTVFFVFLVGAGYASLRRTEPPPSSDGVPRSG